MDGCPGLRELWGYRELIYFFIWRDIKVRYKQTVLGGAWAILQPFFTMLIFSVFFGRLAKVPSDSVPYPLFAFTALVPWQFFANGLSLSSTSLVASSNLVAKVYFPRLALPISKVLSGVVDFLLAYHAYRPDGVLRRQAYIPRILAALFSSCWRSPLLWGFPSGFRRCTSSSETCSTLFLL